MATHSLSEADHAIVTAAVHAAEAQTAGEIVTVIADHSDRYLDVALWWSILLAILALGAVAAFPGVSSRLMASFTNGWVTELSVAEAFELSLAVVVVTFALSRLLLQIWPLRVALTPGLLKANRVRRRAVRYFKVGGERRTVGRTAVLIYLSLSERKAEIVADEAIHEKVDAGAWGDAMGKLIGHAREGRLAEGMANAVTDVGAILSQHFPRGEGDINELPDRLIEI